MTFFENNKFLLSWLYFAKKITVIVKMNNDHLVYIIAYDTVTYKKSYHPLSLCAVYNFNTKKEKRKTKNEKGQEYRYSNLTK